MHRLSTPLILGLSLTTSLLGCGGNDSSEAGDEVGDTTEGDGDGDGDTESGSSTGDGDGDGDTTGDGDGDGDTTGDGDGDGDTTGDGDGDGDTTDGDTTTGGDCMVWEITYDLTGSEFEISDTPFGAGDQVNVLEEPYDDDENVGPGSMVLHFQDVGGDPGGMAFINAYDVVLDFVVSGATTVTSDLDAEVGPVECGAASGPLDGTTANWAPETMADVHTYGTITCEGNLCGLGGFPMPPVDATEDQPISPFEFSADFTTFTMDQTVIQMDDQSTTSWTYEGTEVSRNLVAAPACLCE